MPLRRSWSLSLPQADVFAAPAAGVVPDLDAVTAAMGQAYVRANRGAGHRDDGAFFTHVLTFRVDLQSRLCGSGRAPMWPAYSQGSPIDASVLGGAVSALCHPDRVCRGRCIAVARDLGPALRTSVGVAARNVLPACLYATAVHLGLANPRWRRQPRFLPAEIARHSWGLAEGISATRALGPLVDGEISRQVGRGTTSEMVAARPSAPQMLAIPQPNTLGRLATTSMQPLSHDARTMGHPVSGRRGPRGSHARVLEAQRLYQTGASVQANLV